MRSLGKLLTVAAAFVTAIYAPAYASSGSWTSQVNEPLIYQTNFWVGPVSVPALSGTPSAALISNVSTVWGYNASPYPADPSYALEAYICGGTKCGYINAGNKVGTSDLNDPYWANVAATSTFTFQVHAYSSVNKVFVSALAPSRQFQVTVNYTY